MSLSPNWKNGRKNSSSRQARRSAVRRGTGKSSHNDGFRRLRMDPLEQRHLLSLTPLDVNDFLVNSDYLGTDSRDQQNITKSAASVAVDKDGDFVAVWQHYDSRYGNDVMVPPQSGNYDIYARYFTDQTERLTLPTQVIENGAGQFSLQLYNTSGTLVFTTARIYVDPANADHTASLIEQAFNNPSLASIAPWSFPTIQTTMPTWPAQQAPYATPVTLLDNLYTVSVAPVNRTTFDISFVEQAGKRDWTHAGPDGRRLGALKLFEAYDAQTTQIDLTGNEMALLKMTSPIFQVNTTEPDDTITGAPRRFNQTEPQVAMDADGEFTIVWMSDVPDDVTPGTFSDIFARRFSPMSYIDGDAEIAKLPNIAQPLRNADGDWIYGVRPLGNEFRVNSFTANPQYDPTIAMDPDGNFIVAWGSQGQDISFFNGIMIQRFNRDGDRLGSEFLANTYDTNIHTEPYLALARDGTFGVVWDFGNTLGGVVEAAVFKPTAVGSNLVTTVLPQFQVNVNSGPPSGFVPRPRSVDAHVHGYGYDPTIAFDGNRNFVVAWDDRFATDSNAWNIADIAAKMYNINGGVLRDAFRVNGVNPGIGSPAAFSFANRAYWPMGQRGNQVAVDADGDFTITYDGFGPDVSLVQGQPLLAGAANDILFAQVAAHPDPLYPTIDFLRSDSIVNSTRDGQNQQWVISIDQSVTAGGFTTRIGDGTAYYDYESPPFTNDRQYNVPIRTTGEGLWELDATANAGALDTALSGAPVLGTSWPAPFGGPVDVTWQTGAITSEVQDFTFGVPASGNYTVVAIRPPAAVHTNPTSNPRYLTLDDLVETGNIQFDSTNMTTSAGNLQTALSAFFPGVNVAVAAANRLRVTFGGAYAGVDIKHLVVGNTAGLGGSLSITDVTRGKTMIDYNVTFQGEVHDVAIPLSLVSQNLVMPRTPEIQRITFISQRPSGLFALQVLGLAGQTNDILYQPANPAGMADSIEAELQGLVPNGSEIEVEYVDGTNPFQFVVAFLGPGGGANGPAGINWGPIRPATPAWQSNDPSELWFGDILNQEIQAGATPGSTATEPAVNPVFTNAQTGLRGKTQWEASIAMEPDGDFVSVWTQYADDKLNNTQTPNDGIWYRRFNETTDTAGPTATDFLLSDGRRLEDGGQLQEPLSRILVTFDEEMQNFPGNVSRITNPDNWVLTRNDMPVLGGIARVDFGMNLGKDLGMVQFGSNKWEAVIQLDGNGMQPGEPPLGEGHYQIIARNSLRDLPGNPLGRSGFLRNGANAPRTFEVTVPSGSETRVNDSPNAYGHLLANQPMNPTVAPSSQAVASDSDGDFVTVWTSDEQGDHAVWAKVYDVALRLDKDTTRAPVQIRVSQADQADWELAHPSVAMDKDGDFIVTWAAKAPGSSPDAIYEWDIYARRYTATGAEVSGPTGNVFRVNSLRTQSQTHPSVAIDTDGDFVITWQGQAQSLADDQRPNQDRSGYGIYAQRFSSSGQTLGGTNESQALRFNGFKLGEEATFTLSWRGNVTAPITYNGKRDQTAEAIANALNSLPLTPSTNLQVRVEAVSSKQFVIRFIGDSGSADQPQILLDSLNPSPGAPDASISITTSADGAPGEVLVNDTTANDQIDPAIAMSEDGLFVITWTSYGQDGDAPWQSNIYGKKFAPNSAIRGNQSFASNLSAVSELFPDGRTSQEFLTTVDAPANHTVVAGQGLDGVARVTATLPTGQTSNASGVLLLSGVHVLTAAHVVCSIGSNQSVAPSQVSVTFDVATGPVTIPAANIYILPGYSGDWRTGGHDLAIVVLSQAAPVPVGGRYDIYTSTDEIGKVFDKVGYGESGTGAAGVNAATFPYGTKRRGQNKYEYSSDVVNYYPDMLVYDFDSGNAANDAFGRLPQFGSTANDLGLGTNEVMAGPGDSGGPSFIQNRVAAITVAGDAFPGAHDVQPNILGSFGDVGFDIRVSMYATWVRQIMLGGGKEFLVNNTTAGTATDQRWSAVAMDADGDFVVSWTSYGQDNVGNGYGAGVAGQEGVFARRYTVAAEPSDNQFQVNTFSQDLQQHSSVALDADGDFVITWESFQDRPLPPFNSPNIDPDKPNSFGIFAQRYKRTALTVGPGDLGRIGGELTINTTKDGDQRFPSVTMDDTGDYVIVWSGRGESVGQEDNQGIFMQQFDKVDLPSGPIDDAGPIVTDVWNASANSDPPLQQVFDGAILRQDVSQLQVFFGEKMRETNGVDGTSSVLNPRNWSLTRDNKPFPDAITKVEPQTSPTGKISYILSFADADPDTAGVQPLGPGTYLLTLRERVTDLAGNPLDGNYDGVAGGDFNRTFSILYEGAALDENWPDVIVNTSTIGNQNEPAIASNDDGDTVVVWTSYGTFGDSATQGNIYAQRFDGSGRRVGTEFLVNAGYTTGHQKEPDVAMDANGYFVIVWSGEGIDDTEGIYARRYQPGADPIGDLFEFEVRVNQGRVNRQFDPSVAMDGNGVAIVTWTSLPQDDSLDCIYARRFDDLGNFNKPIDGTINDRLINTTSRNRQDRSDVAADAEGGFVVVWNGDQQDEYGYGIFGQRFDSNGNRVRTLSTSGNREDEFRVNVHGANDQLFPEVAMDLDGDFVVTWSSAGQDGNGFGVFMRRYTAAGEPTPPDRDYQVNEKTILSQLNASVDTANTIEGNFTIVWQSMNQDNYPLTMDNGIYRRTFSGATGLPLNNEHETVVNSIRAGEQTDPVVAVDASGHYRAAWVSSDGSGTGIYGHLVYANVSGGGLALSSTSYVAGYTDPIPAGNEGFGDFTTRMPGIGLTTPGLYDPKTSVFYLRDSNSTGMATYAFGYGVPNSGWIPLIGDWNGDGYDSVGFYDPKTSKWYLRNSNTAGYADIAFGYGKPGAGWIPLVGDWNGDGKDTIGFYDPKTSVWYLRNSNSVGFADKAFGYGIPGGSWKPTIGDWDGNGTTTVGFYDPKLGRFLLRNTNTAGYADKTFGYGPRNSTWMPIIGDWNKDALDSIGFYNPATSMFYLRNSNTTGIADKAFGYGAAGKGWQPLVGQWRPGGALLADGVQPLADGQVLAGISDPLTNDALQSVVSMALARWAEAGVTQDALARMASTRVAIGDLSGARLGSAFENLVVIDQDAAGRGWFVDKTNDDAEFVARGGHLQAVDARAVDRMDLLTVVEHELGHVAGLGDIEASIDSLMSGSLKAGRRRLATRAEADSIFANSLWN